MPGVTRDRIYFDAVWQSKEFVLIDTGGIVTNDEDVVKLYEELTKCRNNFDVQRARDLLNQIEKKISLDIPENRQYFIEVEASLDWMEGKINNEEFARREETATSMYIKYR